MARIKKEIKEELNNTIAYIQECCNSQKYCDKCVFSKFDGFSYYCIFDSTTPQGWEKLR